MQCSAVCARWCVLLSYHPQSCERLGRRRCATHLIPAAPQRSQMAGGTRNSQQGVAAAWLCCMLALSSSRQVVANKGLGYHGVRSPDAPAYALTPPARDDSSTCRLYDCCVHALIATSPSHCARFLGARFLGGRWHLGGVVIPGPAAENINRRRYNFGSRCAPSGQLGASVEDRDC